MGSFLDVLFRGLALAAQSLVVGGATFVLVVLRPWQLATPMTPTAAFASTTAARTRGLIVAGALAVAAAQTASLALALSALADGRSWPIAAAPSTLYFGTGSARLALAASAASIGHALRCRVADRRLWYTLASIGAALVLTSAGTSHAAARLEHRALLISLDALHQLAAGVCVGGLIHLTRAGLGDGWTRWPPDILPRFSAVALVAVTITV